MMKHAIPTRAKLPRWHVTLLTARSGELAYVVESEDLHGAISAACGRASEDDRAWHVLDVLGSRRI